MANLLGPNQGVLNISNIQGNYLSVPMQFKSGNTLINLTQFTEIKMEIKKTYNVNEAPFLEFTVGNGLVISGASNSVLTFVLSDDFWDTQDARWVYDITFETASGQKYTYIKGTITNVLTASKI